MSRWDDAGRRQGTDKSSLGHGYLRHYETILGSRIVTAVLEIGVDEGRSLLLRSDLWPDADVWGIETRRDAPLLDMRDCAVLFGDATTPETIAELPERAWDLVVDDGSHQFPDQAATMALLAPLLGPRGVYVVEDVPWSDTLASTDTIQNILAAMAVHGLRPLAVAFSALRQHAAIIGERLS